MARLLGGEAPIENKTPRAYQSEILQLCQRRNSIVRLDTGMGKTFIAIMLMRWINSLPRDTDQHKLNVFIVPTVALVDQQSEAIARNTSLRVRAYRGDMQVDFWNRERWLSEFSHCDCVVMTAAIWLTVVQHGYWSFEDVSLLVFDECHHCQKRNPYKQIMEEYFQLKGEKPHARLPQILGLTASPLFNPKEPNEEFKELENNLDAVIVTVKDSAIEAAGYSWKPTESALEYSATGHQIPETDFEIELEELEIWDYVNEEKVRNRIENVKRTLGTLASDIYIMHWLWSLRDPVATKSSLHKIRASNRIPDIERLHDKMKKHYDRMPYYTMGDVSDKVKMLVNRLQTYKDKAGFHCIIFVQQRHHAQALATILSKSQTLQTFIRPAYLVGHGSTGAERLNSEGMNAKKQQSTVQQFRDGDINLICATQVGEEGLDFQACNLIIRFDDISTFKGYIQSRGRARKKDCEFVVMIQRDTPEMMKWQQYQNIEKRLEKLYAVRTPAEELDEPELENTPRYIVPETTAVLTYGNAIALLGEACALLPTDAYSPPSKPRYELNEVSSPYSCKVFLPMMPALPPAFREIQGAEVGTKKGAKQAAAFEACKVLHQHGILDDYLLPLREGKGDMARDADDEPVDRTPLDMHIEVDSPNIFGNMYAKFNPTIWLNEVRIGFSDNQVERFGLVCGARLDLEGPLVMHEPGCSFEVHVTAIRRLTLGEVDRTGKMAKLDTFTRWVIKQVVNRKLISGPMLYFVAPLRSASNSWDIDWQAVDNPYSAIHSLSQISAGNLVIAPWQFMRKHIFTVHEVRRDLNPKNMPRITGLTKRGRIFERTGSFGEALIALLDYENIDLTSLDMKEEMLHLKPWFRVRNNLNQASKEGNKQATAPLAGSEAFTNGVNDAYDVVEDDIDVDADIPLAPWEVPDWKWRKYHTKQHEIDEDALDLLDPEDSIEELQPLPAGGSTATSRQVTNAFVLPWSLCKISNISIGVWNAWSWLPSLVRAVHDQAKVQRAMQELSLPPLQFSLVTQALTLPLCCTGKDYQTLETIGDSALKLAVTVVVYNRFHSKDEGGLSARRMNSIDNQHLRIKALKNDLQQHLFTEFFRMRTWIAPTLENGTLSEDGLMVKKTVPRRALSDCIEALLGASYLSGGFDAVLQTGTALGLCFGGPDPWHERYQLTRDVLEAPVGIGLAPLERQLGYKFKHGQLLMQALTHRSFANATTHCQEREEFLGDAVLDNFVIDRLSRKFPTATPSHLTRLRSVLVSNSALGYLALKFMSLHKYIMHATPLLTQHFERALAEAEVMVIDNFVEEIWLFDPPKPAADAVEGIIGSIFIDCGWRLEPVFEVLDRMFAALFQLLPHKEAAPRDPTSRLRLWLQQRSCREVQITTAPRPDIHLPAIVTVTWHGEELSKVSHHSAASAKQLASKMALEQLRAGGVEYVERVCVCRDELAERLAPVREWKKELDTQLKASGKLPAKDDIDRSADPYLHASEDMPHHVKQPASQEVAVSEDLRDAHSEEMEDLERRLEHFMLDSWGYNPEATVPGDHEASEQSLEVESDAPAEDENLSQDVKAAALPSLLKQQNGAKSTSNIAKAKPPKESLLIDFSDDEDDDMATLVIKQVGIV